MIARSRGTHLQFEQWKRSRRFVEDEENMTCESQQGQKPSCEM
jgi:hypothetical protein